MKKGAFTLFREVKSEIKMLRDRDREVKILENSGQFSRNEILQQNYSVKAKKRLLKQMACSSSRNHQHFDTLTIEKSESLFKGEAIFLFADVTEGQVVFLILAPYLGNEKSES